MSNALIQLAPAEGDPSASASSRYSDPAGHAVIALSSHAVNTRFDCEVRHPDHVLLRASLDLATNCCNVATFQLTSGCALHVALDPGWADVASPLTLTVTRAGARSGYFDVWPAECLGSAGGRACVLETGEIHVRAHHGIRVVYEGSLVLAGSRHVLRLDAAPPRILWVRVQDRHGRGLPNSMVRAYVAGRAMAAALTNSEGSAQLALIAARGEDMWLCATMSGVPSAVVRMEQDAASQVIELPLESAVPSVRLVDGRTTTGYDVGILLNADEDGIDGTTVIPARVHGDPVELPPTTRELRVQIGRTVLRSGSTLVPGLQAVDVSALIGALDLVLLRPRGSVGEASVWLRQDVEGDGRTWRRIDLPQNADRVTVSVDRVASSLFGFVGERWRLLAELLADGPPEVLLPMGLRSGTPFATLVAPPGLRESLQVAVGDRPYRALDLPQEAPREVKLELAGRERVRLLIGKGRTLTLEVEPGDVVPLERSPEALGYLVRADWASSVSTCSSVPAGHASARAIPEAGGWRVRPTDRHLLIASSGSGRRVLAEFLAEPPPQILTLRSANQSNLVSIRDDSGVAITGEFEVAWAPDAPPQAPTALRLDHTLVLDGTCTLGFEAATRVHLEFRRLPRGGAPTIARTVLEPGASVLTLSWESAK